MIACGSVVLSTFRAGDSGRQQEDCKGCRELPRRVLRMGVCQIPAPDVSPSPQPRPPKVPLLRASWSLLIDGIWGILKGRGVLVRQGSLYSGEVYLST